MKISKKLLLRIWLKNRSLDKNFKKLVFFFIKTFALSQVSLLYPTNISGFLDAMVSNISLNASFFAFVIILIFAILCLFASFVTAIIDSEDLIPLACKT